MVITEQVRLHRPQPILIHKRQELFALDRLADNVLSATFGCVALQYGLTGAPSSWQCALDTDFRVQRGYASPTCCGEAFLFYQRFQVLNMLAFCVKRRPVVIVME